jgi:hypothetical protein
MLGEVLFPWPLAPLLGPSSEEVLAFFGASPSEEF